MAKTRGTPGQRKRAAELIRLARDEFGRLFPGELVMLRAAAMGGEAILAVQHGDSTDLEWGLSDEFSCWENEYLIGPWWNWEDHRRVRSIVLRWVCSDNNAIALVDNSGISMSYALIVGELNVSSTCIPFIVSFHKCVFPYGIRASFSQTKTWSLTNTVVLHFYAGGARISGSVFLRNDFYSHNEVSLIGAYISGDVGCSGGRFRGMNGVSLDLSGARVQGDVYLRDPFVADADVQLKSAVLDGNLDCSGGEFNAGEFAAISADTMSVGGSVYLRDGFNARGEVRLLGAVIGGELDCDDGIFASGKESFTIESAEINGRFKFTPRSFSGLMNLTNMKVRHLIDDVNQWPTSLILTNFHYNTIHPHLFVSVDSRLDWIQKSDQTCKLLRSNAQLPDSQPYRQLAKVLRAQGHEEDARRVMRACARRRAHARFNNRIAKLNSPTASWMIDRWSGVRRRCSGIRDSLKKWLGKLPWIGKTVSLVDVFARGSLRVGYGALAGHGYNRWRPFAWMIGLILVGSVVFSGLDPWDVFRGADPNPGGMQQTQARAVMDIGKPWLKDYPAFRPLAYSADAFLPLVNLHQETYWTPKDGWVKSFYLPFHILAGWIVTTLAAVSVTGLVRHEKE